MSNTSPDRKKVKTGDATSASSLCSLPGTILADVATYLAVPSHALFAVALTAPSSSWCNADSEQQVLSAASRAILLSASWEVLNFGDVEEELANQVKDKDLYAVLCCIDAVNKLKRIKLINCYSIEGGGLNPLCGSVVLEQMDLSLTEKENKYTTTPQIRLSVDRFGPVLDSIVGKDGCAIRQVDFPKKLNLRGLDSFLHRFSRLISGRQPKCSKCNDICQILNERPPPSWIIYHIGKWIGQQYTCCKCTKDYCLKRQCRVEICSHCGKRHCKQCTSRCDSCGKSEGCTVKCDDDDDEHNCGRKLCSNCVETCGRCQRSGCNDCRPFHRCPACGFRGNGCCEECFEGGLGEPGNVCPECNCDWNFADAY